MVLSRDEMLIEVDDAVTSHGLFHIVRVLYRAFRLKDATVTISTLSQGG